MSVDLKLLADVPIFRLLDDRERAALASLLERRHCNAGHMGDRIRARGA